MLQMVRTLAQFTIALEEMQESAEGTSEDGGGGGPGDEMMDRSTAEPNGNGGGGGMGNPQSGAEVRASQKHVFTCCTCLCSRFVHHWGLLTSSGQIVLYI